MTILRINKKEKNFLLLDKTCLNESNLSWGAKGLHAYLMSLPPDWLIQTKDLKNRASNGRDSVRGLLQELEAAGYISKKWQRDGTTGKYNCLEYVVHELPLKHQDIAKPKPVKPETENPSPANPAPQNTTLISINSNKYTNNKIIKAAANSSDKETTNEAQEETAAVIQSRYTTTLKQTTANKNATHSKNLASEEDSVIGSTLTSNQLARVHSLVQKINHHMEGRDHDVLTEEIQYCLLSNKHFTACGQDFGRKLNAIRKIILRGDWQRPAGLVFEEKQKAQGEIQKLEGELRKYYSEAAHFQKLLSLAKRPAQSYYQKLISQAQDKIGWLVKEIHSIKLNRYPG
jgi:hypothetical protein